MLCGNVFHIPGEAGVPERHVCYLPRCHGGPCESDRAVGGLDTARFAEKRIQETRERNNPHGKPVGPYTGRCQRCHSTDLWDDASMYGCNSCGAWYSNL